MNIQAKGSKLLSPHVVGRNLIGQTNLISYKIDISNEGVGIEELTTLAVTNTIVYLRGKIFNIITSARDVDIAWSRSSSTKLAQSMLSANLLSAEIELLEDDSE